MTASAARTHFKADVLKMIASGQGVPYVAKALGISEALIYKWKQRAKGEEKHSPLNQTSELAVENQRLLHRISPLKTERETLKKALRTSRGALSAKLPLGSGGGNLVNLDGRLVGGSGLRLLRPMGPRKKRIIWIWTSQPTGPNRQFEQSA